MRLPVTSGSKLFVAGLLATTTLGTSGAALAQQSDPPATEDPDDGAYISSPLRDPNEIIVTAQK
ncbi:MAG TPA: hypothetical protein VGB65_14115, partial [Allosphingosinicella sp.]